MTSPRPVAVVRETAPRQSVADNPTAAVRFPRATEVHDATDTPAAAHLAAAELKRLRRRLLRGLDLQTLQGVSRLHERVIRESLGGDITKRNADILSRILGRHGEMVGRNREDEHRERAVALLQAQGAAPALPSQSAELLDHLGLRDLVDPSATPDSAKPGEGA